MTADCVGVDIAKAGRLLQQKPAYGGNIVSVIMGATTPQLATVLPRMYEPLEPRTSTRRSIASSSARCRSRGCARRAAGETTTRTTWTSTTWSSASDQVCDPGWSLRSKPRCSGRGHAGGVRGRHRATNASGRAARAARSRPRSTSDRSRRRPRALGRCGQGPSDRQRSATETSDDADVSVSGDPLRFFRSCLTRSCPRPEDASP